MSARADRRLVFDAHGVVLGNPLPAFLDELAVEIGESPEDLRARWDQDLRRRAWLGQLDDRELWRRLAPGVEDPAARLEARYGLGPAAPHLARWRRHAELWLLSNHRSAWLFPRLRRFGMEDAFDRVLVSDRIGAIKPEPAAFEAALEGLDAPGQALLLDDRLRNVQAARRLGLAAVHARPAVDWAGEVDAWLSCPDSAGGRPPTTAR